MLKWFKRTKPDYPQFWKEYEEKFIEQPIEDISQIRFVALDTETTGFDIYRDRILSIGAVGIKANTIDVSDGFEVYLKQKTFNPETVKIHGLLKNETEDCIPEGVAVKRLLKYLGNSVLVAHHAGFDLKMINRALSRQGLPDLKNKVLDTGRLYRRTLIASNLIQKKKNYSLDELAETFNLDIKDRHTAAGDAFITAMAFLQIVGKLKKENDPILKRLLKI